MADILLRTAGQSANIFTQAIYTGSGILITVQTMLHLAVNTGLVPVTGITLPMISYGGSSLLAMFIIAGICDK
mgnify:CR=1 FL=1